MRCKICGEDFPSKYYFKTGDICNDCYKKQLPTESKETNGKNNIIGIKNNTETPEFKTLTGYGKFISGLGWFIIFLTGILVIIELVSEMEVIFVVSSIFSGAILGILVVVFGQIISCFVSIEKNTRMTYELLKNKEQQE